MKKTIILSCLLSLGLFAQEATDKSLTKLYIATFDKKGLDYWVNTKMPLEDIATSFFDQPETQDKYPSGYGTIDFINAIYSNLFKRTPDQVGSDYWQKELDKNGMIKSKFILAIVNGAKDNDAKILDNKTEVGLSFINSGWSDIDKAKEIMKDVTADNTTVTAALDIIKKYDTGIESELPTIDITTTPTTTKETVKTPTKEEVEEKEDLPTF